MPRRLAAALVRLWGVLLAMTLVLLLCALIAVADGGWTDKQVEAVHPKDMTQVERAQWNEKMQKLEQALEQVNDPNKYEEGKYECNDFSDFAAKKLAEMCYTVKRAKSMQFTFPDGTKGEHHWVFVVVKVGDRVVWVPVECSPPEGEKQKGEKWDDPQRQERNPRMEGDQWPWVEYEKEYFDPDTLKLMPGYKFNDRYFGKLKIRDVAKKQGCADPLAALIRTYPLAVLAQDAATGEPLSLPVEFYGTDGVLVERLTTGTDGMVRAELLEDTYLVKARVGILWFEVAPYSSEVVLDRPYNLNILVSTLIPVKYVPAAVYLVCGLLAAFLAYSLVRLAR